MYKKIMIALFSVFLIGLPILTFAFLSPEAQPFSENENRYLAALPKLSMKTIEDKTFMNKFDLWISDRFIFRENWIMLKNDTEQTIGKTEINGVYTTDGRMIELWKTYDAAVVEKNLTAMNSFAGRHPDMPMYFLLAPNAQEIYQNTMLSSTVIGNQRLFIKNAYAALTNFTGTIDVYTLLNEYSDQYIYYRTDHHWTSFGAFLGYSAAGNKLGYTPYDISDFNIEHASSDFRGTLYSKTLDSTITPDVIDYYTLASGDPTVTLSVFQDNGTYKDYDSLYFRSFLEVKDKYSSFTGSNAGIVTIKSDIENSNGKILVIKDSYAHSLVPFLTKNYDTVTMIDFRYINVDFQNFISLEDYDQVLFLCNVITFSDDSSMAKLNLCK